MKIFGIFCTSNKEKGMNIKMKNVKLYAFPYAFGGASAYKKLSIMLDEHINLISLNYAGHEERISETLLPSIHDMALDIYKIIKHELDNEYSLLGYSMGCLVCYELYHILIKNKKKLPIKIFLFASDSPDFKRKTKYRNNMNIEDVRKLLIEYGNTPDEILQNDELLELIAPIVINDIYAIDHYVPTDSMVNKIECPVILGRGDLEKNIESCKSDWDKFFREESEYIIFKGNHFFMFEESCTQLRKVAETIEEKLYDDIVSI